MQWIADHPNYSALVLDGVFVLLLWYFIRRSVKKSQKTRAAADE